MGCDIHLYIEHAHPQPDDKKLYWQSLGGRINPGRDYDLFAKIAGVREYSDQPSKCLIPPKGSPVDLGWSAADDDRFRVIPDGEEESGEREVNRSRAEEWIKYGSHWIALDEGRPEYWVSDPDNHSHTWLTPQEFRAALEATRDPAWGIDAEYFAVLAAVEELVRHGKMARLVIWFDN